MKVYILLYIDIIFQLNWWSMVPNHLFSLYAGN